MMRLFILGIAFSFSFITAAQASSTGAVGSPKVKAGETAVELRGGYTEADENSSDDERFRARVHVDHGFNDFYALRVIGSVDDRKNDNLEHDALAIENRFYLLKAQEHGFDFGMRLGYSNKDGDKKPSSASIGFYEMVNFSAYELRMNQTFDHEVGEDSGDGVGADLRFQVTRSIAEKHKAGLESFHDIGNLTEQSGYDDQSHTIGPVFKGTLIGDYKYETGYRAGISDAAPDHTFKFFVARSF